MVDQLGEQGAAADRHRLGGKVAVGGVVVHAHEARLVGGELERLGDVGVGRVGVVQDDVLLGGGVHRPLGDAAVHQHVVEAQERLDVGHAEGGLHRDVLIAQMPGDVLRVHHVQEVGVGNGVVLEEHLQLAPAVGQGGLQVLARSLGGSGAQEVEEVLADAALDVAAHGVVSVGDGLLVALVVDGLKGGLLAPLLDHQLKDVGDLGLVLGERDVLALAHGAVGKLAGDLVGLHVLPRLLLDLAGEAQHLHEHMDVLLEVLHEVDLGSAGEVRRLLGVGLCCHSNPPICPRDQGSRR